MFQRLLSSLLIFVLLAQAVVAPHSHAGTAPDGHNHQAHVHLSRACRCGMEDRDGRHRHRHKHTHSHQHDSDIIDDHTENSEDTRKSVSVGHHDDDAVYIADAFATGKASRFVQYTASLQFELPLLGLSAYVPPVPSLRMPRALGPPAGRFGCPIYLQTLSLLI